MQSYLFDAGALSWGFDGGQADGDGQVGGFNALGDSRANFGSHDTQIAESLECCDDFNFILGVRDLALVGQHLGYFSGQLEDIGVGLAFFLVLDAIATSHASQRQKSNGRVRSALNQRLQNNLFWLVFTISFCIFISNTVPKQPWWRHGSQTWKEATTNTNPKFGESKVCFPVI